MDEVMQWSQMWAGGRYFELATELQPIRQPPKKDKRLSVDGAVICCTAGGEHWAAIGYEGYYVGFNERYWYSTLTSTTRKRLKVEGCSRWSQMWDRAENVRVVTAWEQLKQYPDERRRGWET